MPPADVWTGGVPSTAARSWTGANGTVWPDGLAWTATRGGAQHGGSTRTVPWATATVPQPSTATRHATTPASPNRRSTARPLRRRAVAERPPDGPGPAPRLDGEPPRLGGHQTVRDVEAHDLGGRAPPPHAHADPGRDPDHGADAAGRGAQHAPAAHVEVQPDGPRQRDLDLGAGLRPPPPRPARAHAEPAGADRQPDRAPRDHFAPGAHRGPPDAVARHGRPSGRWRWRPTGG